MTAGIGMRHGAVAWRAKGLYSCHQPLPCPHQSLAGYTSASGAPVASIGLRLVERGSVSGSTHGGKPTFSQDASVTIEGFDLTTGRTLWSFNAGRNVPLMSAQGPLPLVGPTSIVLTRGSDKIALDLRNGNTRTVKASAPAWCQRFIQYHLSHTGYYNGGGGNYVGQEALYPCTVSRVRRDVPATIPRLVRLFGATTGGMTAWTDTGAVHAVPSSSP